MGRAVAASVRALALGAAYVVTVPVLLEVSTRLIGLRSHTLPPAEATGERALWVYDAAKGWFHRPGSRTQDPRPSAAGAIEAAGRIHINSLGLRGAELREPRPPGATRVLVLGDSFAFGVGVDDEHTLAARLEALLRHAGGAAHEVVNAAVSGYSTDQELLLLRELGPRLRPDLVLLVFCDNDFVGNTRDFMYLRYYKPYFELTERGLALRNVPVPELSAWQRGKLWLAGWSNLWNLLRERDFGFFQIAVPLPAPPDERQLQVTAALIAAVQETAASLGAPLWLMSTGHAGERRRLLRALVDGLRGPRWLPFNDRLKSLRRSRPESAWHLDQDRHWSLAGHDAAARYVHEQLLATGVLADVSGTQH